MQTYSGSVTLRNNLSATVDVSVRPGSSDRYSVHPERLVIKPGDVGTVDIKLKILRFASMKKATLQGQRDIFHIKAKTTRLLWSLKGGAVV